MGSGSCEEPNEDREVLALREGVAVGWTPAAARRSLSSVQHEAAENDVRAAVAEGTRDTNDTGGNP